MSHHDDAVRPVPLARVLIVGLASLVFACAAPAGQDTHHAAADRHDPGRYELVRFPHATRGLITRLEAMQASGGADIWTHTPMVGRPLEVALDPARAAELRDAGWRMEAIDDGLFDLSRPIAHGPDGPDGPGGDVPDDWYARYRDLDALTQRWTMLEALREPQHPGLVRSALVGHSIEGRPITAYHVTGAPSDDRKPIVVVVGGTHAREWIAHMSTTYALEHLVRGYGVDDRVTDILDNSEFVFVPMLNPDGFVYDSSISVDPPASLRWRKNRWRAPEGHIFGVDLNRNYAVRWGHGAGPGGGGGETFPGTGPFSEPETAALEAYLLPMADRVAAFADIHAYGSYLIAPYSYESGMAPHRRASMTQASFAIVDAMNAAADLEREMGWISNTGYGGSSKDWSFDTFDAVTWTFELSIAFVPPASWIGRWGPALHAGLVELGGFVARPLQIAIESPRPLTYYGEPSEGWAELGEPQPWLVDVRDGTGELDPASVRAWQRFAGQSELAPATIEPVEPFEERGYRVLLGPLSCSPRVDGLVLEARTLDGQTVRYPESGVFEIDVPALGDCPCAVDLDGDGELTIFDFLAFQNFFDDANPLADFDGDGELTIFDFLAFKNAFDAGCP